MVHKAQVQWVRVPKIPSFLPTDTKQHALLNQLSNKQFVMSQKALM